MHFDCFAVFRGLSPILPHKLCSTNLIGKQERYNLKQNKTIQVRQVRFAQNYMADKWWKQNETPRFLISNPGLGTWPI
jgi:hypothetical protein